MNFTEKHTSKNPLNHTPSVQDTLEWSVIVITRNEEAVIGDCLKSVVEAFNEYAYELIVVDSASTDRTVAIAQTFKASIIQLPSTAPLRPAVGRHVGFQASHGKWILFLDGDSILEPTWVTPATTAFRSEQELGGIAGERESILPAGKGEAKRFYDPYPKSDYQSAECLNGPAAYKRDALEHAGGFNPFLHSVEEAELGARLRKNGYSLRRLHIPMTKHYLKYSSETTLELIRRIRRGYYLGLGEFVRYVNEYDLPVHKPFKTVHRHIEFFALMVLGMVTAVASIILGQKSIFLMWIALLLLIFVLFTFRARNFRKPAYYFLEWTLTSPIVICGILKSPHKVKEFPNILPKDASSSA